MEGGRLAGTNVKAAGEVGTCRSWARGGEKTPHGGVCSGRPWSVILGLHLLGPSQSLLAGLLPGRPPQIPRPQNSEPGRLLTTSPLPADRRSQGLSSRVQKWFYERFGEYLEDFRFQPEENTVETEEPLSARR